MTLRKKIAWGVLGLMGFSAIGGLLAGTLVIPLRDGNWQVPAFSYGCLIFMGAFAWSLWTVSKVE